MIPEQRRCTGAGAGRTITVTVRLFGGLHERVDLPCVDAVKGVPVTLPEGSTVATALRRLGLPRPKGLVCVADGEPVGAGAILYDGAVLSLCRLVAGG